MPVCILVFKLEGCQRVNEDNLIRGLVEEHAVEELNLRDPTKIATSPEALAQLQGLPLLPRCRVSCLNPQNNVWTPTIDGGSSSSIREVSDEVFPIDISPFDTTGVVPDLDQIPTAEEYKNERAYTDGEIFRKIRLYHKCGSTADENRWWARLTDTKRKVLRQLLKDEQFATAFDNLLPWPGLWTPIRLGSHRLLTLKCDEEMLHYLRAIHAAWSAILSSARAGSHDEMVDNSTVEHLQGLCPALSSIDADTVRRLMRQQMIFPTVLDATVRTRILSSILIVPDMVPSLFTFFEDLKFEDSVTEL
ncbi:hypothetical protein LTR53_001393 [Teratosphaeriaceae sp. CCFEE 6253]|nr:hypothetical protein LTR53_001393 [Teratosphaeriaceae sp. CCFEE 6253]